METDFLVIGSGISGLSFALQASKKGKVILITKKKLIDSNTNFAQGGIAGVLDKTDNIEKHVEDTLKAGCFHNDKKAVRFMVSKSKAAIYQLIKLGVNFESKNKHLLLTREGGHSKNRIAYVGDYTGQEIEKVLIQRNKENPNIKILENCFAIKLIKSKKKCIGALIIHKKEIKPIFAKKTILATGGTGQIFLNTTNPKIATGDGIAMGHKAGAESKDMEFIQFHPTALAKNITPKFLISETLRGEGAKLVNSENKYFMENAHSLKDLAPRDVISKAIWEELKKGKVYLDIRSKNKKYLKKRFPQIYEKLKSFNISMENDLIPITPAVHYLCGGLKTNLKGETNIQNLYAFGETAYTGVHGANRLASNSLLEALVFSNQIIKSIKNLKELKKTKIKIPKLIDIKSQENIKAKEAKKEIKKLMWEYMGIERNKGEIEKKCIPRLSVIIKELELIKGVNQELQEAKNMCECALLMTKSAIKRKKSLGCHQIK